MMGLGEQCAALDVQRDALAATARGFGAVIPDGATLPVINDGIGDCFVKSFYSEASICVEHETGYVYDYLPRPKVINASLCDGSGAAYVVSLGSTACIAVFHNYESHLKGALCCVDANLVNTGVGKVTGGLPQLVALAGSLYAASGVIVRVSPDLIVSAFGNNCPECVFAKNGEIHGVGDREIVRFSADGVRATLTTLSGDKPLPMHYGYIYYAGKYYYTAKSGSGKLEYDAYKIEPDGRVVLVAEKITGTSTANATGYTPTLVVCGEYDGRLLCLIEDTSRNANGFFWIEKSTGNFSAWDRAGGVIERRGRLGYIDGRVVKEGFLGLTLIGKNTTETMCVRRETTNVGISKFAKTFDLGGACYGVAGSGGGSDGLYVWLIKFTDMYVKFPTE